jgi:DNA-binding winged helix-turn-helix (wHTH) protein
MISAPFIAPKAVPREPLVALQFDAFQLLPKRRQLMRQEHAVRIGGRAFDLLVALVSRPGEIVPHAELIDAAWPNLVVSGNNLKTQIAALQRILGESPAGGRYIRNVALRGYVFVGEVLRMPWLCL